MIPRRRALRLVWLTVANLRYLLMRSNAEEESHQTSTASILPRLELLEQLCCLADDLQV